MNDKQRRRIERLKSSESFGTTNAADFPATSKGGQALARLRKCIAEAEECDTQRATSQRVQQQASGNREDERDALRRHITDIVETADTVALDHPDLKGVFARPRKRVNDQTLLGVARSIAAEVEKHKALFLEYDMQPDFFDVFNASIESFEKAIGQQTAGAQARVSANASLEDALTRAETELERLDTAVRNKYRGDAARLAAWESARHLERASQRKNGSNKAAPKDGSTGDKPSAKSQS